MTEPAVAHDPESLLALIAPLLTEVAALDPAARVSAEEIAALEASLRARFPPDGPLLRAVEASLAQGVHEGWLCDRGAPHARFCRIAKATPASHGLSVDIVSLEGRAVEHTHPKGEVTIGFAVASDDTAQFVFVVEEVGDGVGRVIRREVGVGSLTDDGGLEILRGLEDGERIVTAPGRRLA